MTAEDFLEAGAFVSLIGSVNDPISSREGRVAASQYRLANRHSPATKQTFHRRAQHEMEANHSLALQHIALNLAAGGQQQRKQR